MKAIYARVSTTEQAEKGYSLADQVRLCREKAETTDIIEYIDDGYSGEFMGRPALDKLLHDLETRPITHVIIYDPDRLARNSELQLSLAAKIESYAKLVFVTYEYDCSPEGKLFFTMKAGISAYEKAKIISRTTRGKISKAMQGKIPSNYKTIGYDWDAKKSMYVVNADEAKLVRRIYEMYLNGAGLRKIAFILNDEGIKTKKENRWCHKAINDILRNETYAGKLHYGRTTYRLVDQGKRRGKPRKKEEWVTIDVPPIITPEEYAKAQEQVKINTKYAKRNTKHIYLLQGIIKCQCGYGMEGITRVKNGKEYSYYCCHDKLHLRRCKSHYVPAAKIEDEVWQHLQETIKSGKPLYSDLPDTQQLIEENNKAIADLEKQRKTISRLHAQKLYDDAEAESALYRIAQELGERKNKSFPQQPQRPNISLADINASKTPEEKKKLLQAYGIKIIVDSPALWAFSFD